MTPDKTPGVGNDGSMEVSEVETLLTDLDRRLRRTEDLLELHQLVAEYGPAVDGGSSDAAAAHWTEDGRYCFGPGPNEQVAGRQALTELFDGVGHQAIIAGGSGHIVTPPALHIDGDEAWGSGYSILFRFEGQPDGDPADGWRSARVSSVHWYFRRVDGRWRTVERTNHLLTGAAAARQLFSSAFTDGRFTPEQARG